MVIVSDSNPYNVKLSLLKKKTECILMGTFGWVCSRYIELGISSRTYEIWVCLKGHTMCWRFLHVLWYGNFIVFLILKDEGKWRIHFPKAFPSISQEMDLTWTLSFMSEMLSSNRFRWYRNPLLFSLLYNGNPRV